MKPASSEFCEMLTLVCSSVRNREIAEAFGGKTGQALQRLANQRSRQADMLLAELTGTALTPRP